MARGGTKLKHNYDKHTNWVDHECIFPKIPTHDSTYKQAYSSKTQRKKQDTEFEKDVPNIISSYWSLTKPDLFLFVYKLQND